MGVLAASNSHICGEQAFVFVTPYLPVAFQITVITPHFALANAQFCISLNTLLTLWKGHQAYAQKLWLAGPTSLFIGQRDNEGVMVRHAPRRGVIGGRKGKVGIDG